MSIRGHPVRTLVGSLALCLCVAQMAHAVGTFDVSDRFVLDTREGPAFALSNLFTLDTRAGPSFGLSALFVLDTRESGSNTGYSNIFVLDTRESGSNEGYSNIFVLDTRESGSNEGYSNIFVLDTRGPALVFGDVSDNGEVTASDATIILQHAVDLITLTGRDALVADVTGNGAVTPYDASLVLQYVVRKITRFPVEESVQARVMAFSRSVGIPRVGSTSEGYLTIPVAIDDIEGVLSGEMVVSFDPEKVEAVSVVSSALLSTYLTEQNITDGKVLVSFAGAESGDGSGEVLEVAFRPVGETVEALRGIRLEGVQLNEGQVVVTLANDGRPDVPTAYALHPNFPNPFNPETTIRYDVPMPGRVSVVVYNLSGQRVRELASGLRDAGRHTVVWDGRASPGREVGSGVYLCRLVAGRHEDVRRMVVVK